MPEGESKGKNTKTLGWIELWAAGRQILGLSENEFWSLSPRELSELFRLENKIRKKRKNRS